MDDSLLDGFARPLSELCGDEPLRRAEAGEGLAAMWASIDALGYTDALVPETLGGAGLALADFYPLVFAAGKAGLPLPFAETAMARAILASAGQDPGRGCIAIAPALPAAGSAIVCRDVPGAGVATHVLVSWRGEWLWLRCDRAEHTPGSYRPLVSASLRWTGPEAATLRLPTQDADAEAICSALHAAGMAGAMSRIQDLCVAYASDRRQFGRAIGQFQAVQQELSVLAEQVAAATLAARLGCAASGGYLPDALLAATARLRAGEAAARVAAIAHAVHGAIGITEEHVLGLFTRRLHEWRAAPATESRCAARLGNALLAEPALTVFDFVRTRLMAAPMEAS
uniref:acyl-CoA dehydrogenase family protein n=1 Tax=Cupriavidus taiwanensis TaxID=164546 RepID=UPI000E2051A6|nr:acyl-CoA dehydrogenase family protein [Cupriavidus taiwanensis]